MNELVKLVVSGLLKDIKPAAHFSDDTCEEVSLSLTDDGKTAVWSGKSESAELTFRAEYTDISAVFYIDVKSTRPLGDKPVIIPA